jgi:hypothetical protein
MPGSIIAVQVFGLTAGSFAAAATAFAINMIASSIIARAFGPKGAGDSANTSSNPGNNQQVGPAGDNKVPVIYGTAFAGGIITDLSITNDNQTIYYVLTLAEVDACLTELTQAKLWVCWTNQRGKLKPTLTAS